MENEGTDVGDERERGGKGGSSGERVAIDAANYLQLSHLYCSLVWVLDSRQTDRPNVRYPRATLISRPRKTHRIPSHYTTLVISYLPTSNSFFLFLFLSFSLSPSLPPHFFHTLVIRFTDLTLVRDASYLSSSKTY